MLERYKLWHRGRHQQAVGMAYLTPAGGERAYNIE